jgi:hypothetical protein
MFVLFVENANCFSLESSVGCASSECTKFIIESFMVEVCPWWSEVPTVFQTLNCCGRRSIFLVSICNFPRYSIVRRNKSFWAGGRSAYSSSLVEFKQNGHIV